MIDGHEALWVNVLLHVLMLVVHVFNEFFHALDNNKDHTGTGPEVMTGLMWVPCFMEF